MASSWCRVVGMTSVTGPERAVYVDVFVVVWQSETHPEKEVHIQHNRLTKLARWSVTGCRHWTLHGVRVLCSNVFGYSSARSVHGAYDIRRTAGSK